MISYNTEYIGMPNRIKALSSRLPSIYELLYGFRGKQNEVKLIPSKSL